MRKIIKNFKGITLIELMLVLAILSVVILASLSVFENMNKAEKYFTKKGDQFLDKIFAYQTIREDFQYISPSFNFLSVLIPHPDHPDDETKELDFFSFIPDKAIGLLCRSASGLINPKRTLVLKKGEKAFSFLKNNLSVRTKLVEPIQSFLPTRVTNNRNDPLSSHRNGTLTFKAGFYYGNRVDKTYKNYFKDGYAFFFATENIRTIDFDLTKENTYFPRRYAFLWKVHDANDKSCDQIANDVCKTELSFNTKHPQTTSKDINTAGNFLKFLPSFNSSIPVVLAQKVDIITYEVKDHTYQGKATTKLTRKINGTDEEILAIDIDEVKFERPCIAQKNISVFLKYKKIDF